MSKAEEKRAFDAMMAEISDDSDSDENVPRQLKASIAKLKSAKSSKSNPKVEESGSMSTITGVAPPKQTPHGPSGTQRGSKMSREEESIEQFGAQTSSHSQEQLQTDQNLAAKRWLLRPCHPSDPPTLCFVEREKAGFGRLHPVYRCYLEVPDGQARFLMAAKKRAGSKTSNYLVSLDMEPDDRGSDSVLGKIRGNAVGSQYLFTDHGLAPDKTMAPSMLRKELGTVKFEFDSGGPSRVGAWIPQVSESGTAAVWQPSTDEQSMEARVEANDFERLTALENKKPKWDNAHGGHVLNFQGRVTESSVKNFQLSYAENELGLGDEVLLQFGRVGKDKFNMDVRHPLSLFQAFVICVACMDGKLADRKGYEYIRRLAGGDGTLLPTTADGKSSGLSSTSEGSVSGSKSFAGALRQALPSGQYIRDKISRSFGDP